jgi:cytochrome c2
MDLRRPPLALCLATLFSFACSPAHDENGAAPAARGASPDTVAERAASPAELHGDPARGRLLAVEYECTRCHDGVGDVAAFPTERHCTHCHDDIGTGRFGAGTTKIGQWKKSVAPYRHAPSLEALGERLRPEWVSEFLEHPVDLRPNLAATMPRLRIGAAEARDLAAYVTTSPRAPRGPKPDGDASAGRTLMEAKGCGGCHAFTGAPSLSAQPDLASAGARRKAVELAPDLRFVRYRFDERMLVPWLVAPSSMKPGTSMPTFGFTEKEARDIATYLLTVPISAPIVEGEVVRLPVLRRPVTYREVEARVFSTTCRHCHGDPDVAGGDGGPGNTGGFGFAPRRLDLTSYESTAAGYVGDDGERHSVFQRDEQGVPLLVVALVARRNEEAGHAGTARGMPLGLPSVGLEDIQLVESWIAQGRPR